MGIIGNNNGLRAVEFANELIRFTKKITTIHGDSLVVQVGIDSGMVAGSSDNLKRVLNSAKFMKTTSKPSCIHLTELVKDQIKSTRFQVIGPELKTIDGTTTASYTILC